MKAKGWIVCAVLAGGTALGFHSAGGCLDSGKAPDEKLAVHFDALCAIARANLDSPERGVRELGRYFGKHTDDMLADFGATLQTIETIADDDKHDARARVARDRIQRPLIECHDDWQRFGEAVESDPDASQLLERGLDRLGRTFEIIFSSRDAKTLPDQLLRKLSI